MPTGVPNAGHAARQRLDHRQPEALVLRRHEHGVGGVDPVRDLVRRRRRPSVSSGASPAASTRAVEALERPRRVVREQQVRAVGVEPEARARLARAGSAGSARGRCRRAARRRAASSPRPGTLALNSRETAAGSAVNGSAARVTRFERGWKRSLPCSVTTTGAEPREQRRPRRQAEVRVHDVEAPARDSGAAVARGARRSRARRARRRTARPRRRRGAAAPRPGRARTSPAPGRSGVGYMFVTTSARTAAPTVVPVTPSPHALRALRSPSRLDPSHPLSGDSFPTAPPPRAAGTRDARADRTSMIYELMGRGARGGAAPCAGRRARAGHGRVRRPHPARRGAAGRGGDGERRLQGQRRSPTRSSRSSRARSTASAAVAPPGPAPGA